MEDEKEGLRNTIIIHKKVLEQLPLRQSSTPHTDRPRCHTETDQKTSTFSRTYSLWQTYQSKYMKMMFKDEVRYRELSLPPWNRYLWGIFCFLNKRRDLLQQIILQQPNQQYKLTLYHEHIKSIVPVRNIFQRDDELRKNSRPLVTQNGKLEFWNCILDYMLRVNRNYKTKEFLEWIFGLPVEEVSPLETVMFHQWLKDHISQQMTVFLEGNNENCFVRELLEWELKGQMHLFVVVGTYSNLICNIKNSEMYERCSKLQKLLLERFEKNYLTVVEINHLSHYFRKCYVVGHLGDFNYGKWNISGRKVLVVEAKEREVAFIRLWTNGTVAMAKIDRHDTQIQFKRNVQEFHQEYTKLEEGYYEIQSSASCLVEIFSSKKLLIAEQTFGQYVG